VLRSGKVGWTGRVLLAALALMVGGCDWPTFAAGPARTGNNRSERRIGVDNVAGLEVAWRAHIDANIVSSPVTYHDRVYVADFAGELYAFDADGETGCGGQPTTCEPLWTATVGSNVFATPTVAGGIVYVGDQHGHFAAFDARGVRGCSGTPKRCEPLWTAELVISQPGGAFVSSPAVVGGKVYVGSPDGNLYVLDAHGRRGCTTTTDAQGALATSCEPLWIAPVGDFVEMSPAVVGGTVYVGALNSRLVAFDALGIRGCGGEPRTCEPLWSADLGAGGIFGSVAVEDGRVYAATFAGLVAAFDARGRERCSGSPRVCAALWTARPGGDELTGPSVAGGLVYVTDDTGRLSAYDAAGRRACAGTPVVCRPVWTAQSGRLATSLSMPSVANGVVYASSLDGMASAFDARGKTGCVAGTPARCSPLWSVRLPDIVDGAPAIADGTVYIASIDGTLNVFAP
jgi:outer membrane protein assembly factor BamB